MQKLNMIQAYRHLEETNSVVFVASPDNADQARLVKFRIITEQDVVLQVSDVDYTPEIIDPETGEVIQPRVVENVRNTRLLTCVTKGFDEVEFYYQGTFALNLLGGDIWLSTFDSAFVDTTPSDFTNYARLWEREERDPRILEIERAARHNQEALKRQMMEDFAAHAAAMEARYAASVTPPKTDAASGTASDQSGVSTGAPAGDPPAAAPAGTGATGEQNDGA